MSSKGRDTSMKEKRGRSLTLPKTTGIRQQETKGRSPTLPKTTSIRQQETKRRSSTLPKTASIRQQETRGRSPSSPRKTEIGQRGRSLNAPLILERNKTSTSVESRKVPTIPWPSASLSRGHSARNPIKIVSPPKTKSLRRSLDRPTPPSKVMSTKLKSNPKNSIASSMKTSGSLKPTGTETSRPPLKLKNSVNVKGKNGGIKKQTNQTTKGLGSKIMAIEKKPTIPNALSSSQNNQNILIHEENNHKIATNEEHNHSVVTQQNNDILHGEVNIEDDGEIRVSEPSNSVGLVVDQDMLESEISCDDNVSFDRSVDNKHTYDHDGHINQQDQVDKTFDIISDHLDHTRVDQELENGEVVQEANVGSTDENGEAMDDNIEETNVEELEHVEVEPEYPYCEETKLELKTEEPEQEETERDELVHEESKLEELEHEERNPDEHEETDTEEAKCEETNFEEDDVEVPTNEDTTSKVVIKNQQVVINGKKESATYNDVIEETVSKLREQRKNKVLALAGAFETVISLESDSPPKDLSPKNLSPKNLSPKNIY